MKGLLLVGGKSSRMGSNKSELVLRDGLTQRERGEKLLESVCDEVYVSTRDDAGEKNTITDAFGSIGPLGAIASAQQNDPNSAWLVLACDLPLLEPEHLTQLADLRQPEKDATCFTSATDGLPEPLCTIWEPSSVTPVKIAVEANKRCPRSVLLSLDTNALPSPGLWPLANTNTEADLVEIKARLNKSTTVKTITVSYFAQLRELTGTSSETLETDSETPAGLFEEIRAKHTIPLKRKGMMVAVNGDFTDWTHKLTEGEEVVFIPPVAGG
ncbi:MAG: NTP transferase domain-containing protein [Akkermansiaceae bacterium]